MVSVYVFRYLVSHFLTEYRVYTDTGCHRLRPLLSLYDIVTTGIGLDEKNWRRLKSKTGKRFTLRSPKGYRNILI